MFSFQSAFVSNYSSETAYLLYHRFLNLSSTFSEFFVIFLEIIFRCIYCFIQSIPIGFLYSFGRLIYYITAFPFCQVLFRLFSKSFCDVALVRRLVYYITNNYGLSTRNFSQSLRNNHACF